MAITKQYNNTWINEKAMFSRKRKRQNNEIILIKTFLGS